jgi:hypothetical protein
MTATAPPRLGATPTLREDLDRALGLIAALTERIVALEAGRDADDQVDGPAPAPLPPNWVPLKRAVEISGYSASALRKLKSPRWWKYDAGRVRVDVDACPRKAAV